MVLFCIPEKFVGSVDFWKTACHRWRCVLSLLCKISLKFFAKVFILFLVYYKWFYCFTFHLYDVFFYFMVEMFFSENVKNYLPLLIV